MNIANISVDQPSAGDPIETAWTWLQSYEAIALATVVSTWGSSPVPVGGQLVVAPDGHFRGSVSGGCVELDVIAAAESVIAQKTPKLVEFGVADENAWRAGLPCGGNIKVFVAPMTRADLEDLETIMAARKARRAIAVVTNVATGKRQVLDHPPGMDTPLGVAFGEGQSKIITIDSEQLFVNVQAPTLRIMIAGATHIAQVLADLATRIGHDVIVVDPRPAFASSYRFGAIKVVEDWPEAACASIGLDSATAVVCLTHTAHLDDQMLGAALRSNCLYVGALGSRKTHAKRLERLQAAGFSDADCRRIHAPVGLDIGANGPAEIAVSILSQIIAVHRGVMQ